MQPAQTEEHQCNSKLARKIIIPVDNSDNVHDAFDWFFKYGYRKTDHIIFAHVVQPTFAHDVINLEGPLYNPREEVKLNFDEAHKIEATYKKLANEAHVNFSTTCLTECDIGEAILELAAKEKANLIVVGYSGVHHTPLGEVTHHLVVESKIPVLVVPPVSKD
ncbi:hypothetical protein ACTXT7_011560 [Hymenolepis weldensis]